MPGASAVGEMLVPSNKVVGQWRWCSRRNEGKRQTELQNLTERVFPALAMARGYRGRESATQVNPSRYRGWGWGGPGQDAWSARQALVWEKSGAGF